MYAEPVSPYTLVATVGPDGVGKTTLARALASVLARFPGRASAPRSVQTGGFAAEVFEFRGSQQVFQHVDFGSDAAEQALLTTARFSCAILAVSAPDGVLPGARRSLEHARAAGISNIVVALTRCDAIEDVELLDLVELETRELATGLLFGGDAMPVIRCAARSVLQGDPRHAERLVELANAIEGVGNGWPGKHP